MKEESLYDLIKLTLLGSELTYAVSLMRELGRRELLGDDSKAALQLPVNAKEFQRIIKAHPDLAAVFEGQNEDSALQFSAVDHAVERNTVPNNTSNTPSSPTRRFEKDTRGSMRIFQEEVGTTANDNNNNDGHTLTDATSDDLIQGSEIVYFKDQAELGYREQTEMVYAISVDSIEKRVNVVFRGSRTSADWAANKKFNGKAVPNPVKELEAFANDTTLPDEVYIHEGFYNYLHQGEGSDVGVFDNLLPILNKHPTYGLNVTGHSLGGALASLFAVSAACREDIPKPVWCITHAQPLVGDKRLLQSVRKLEESNNLLLLRTRNCEDGVPQVPAFSPKPNNFTYIHIGMELKMYDDDRSKNIKLSRSEKKFSLFVLNFKALIKLFVIKAGQDKQRRAHSLREHYRRLEMYEDKIRSLGDKLEDIPKRTETVIL